MLRTVGRHGLATPGRELLDRAPALLPYSKCTAAAQLPHLLELWRGTHRNDRVTAAYRYVVKLTDKRAPGITTAGTASAAMTWRWPADSQWGASRLQRANHGCSTCRQSRGRQDDQLHNSSLSTLPHQLADPNPVGAVLCELHALKNTEPLGIPLRAHHLRRSKRRRRLIVRTSMGCRGIIPVRECVAIWQVPLKC